MIGMVLSILHVSCALILIVFPKCWYSSSSGCLGVGVWVVVMCTATSTFIISILPMERWGKHIVKFYLEDLVEFLYILEPCFT